MNIVKLNIRRQKGLIQIHPVLLGGDLKKYVSRKNGPTMVLMPKARWPSGRAGVAPVSPTGQGPSHSSAGPQEELPISAPISCPAAAG